jgi:aspartyl-tRNA(Asn)/glutamyl-tRNA(Gln) amidotransferase subunit C
MKLTREEIEHIAKLARLTLTDEEKVLFQGQLSEILNYFEKLQELDTENIPPTASVLPLRNVMRADQTGPSLPRDEALSNSPSNEDGQFQVPKALE